METNKMVKRKCMYLNEFVVFDLLNQEHSNEVVDLMDDQMDNFRYFLAVHRIEVVNVLQDLHHCHEFVAKYVQFVHLAVNSVH